MCAASYENEMSCDGRWKGTLRGFSVVGLVTVQARSWPGTTMARTASLTARQAVKIRWMRLVAAAEAVLGKSLTYRRRLARWSASSMWDIPRVRLGANGGVVRGEDKVSD